MTAQPVEWVLVVHYGPEAHRATYGRQVRSDRYTKDYIQLSRKKEFLEAVSGLFSVAAAETSSVPLTYRWPEAMTPGAFVFNSSDRPHLKWETSLGAPKAWKMTVAPSDTKSETIPGDPTHLEFVDAEREFALLAERGAGQPYLMAIKLRDEPRTLHLRAYLKNPSNDYAWADLGLVPLEVQALAAKTSQKSALAWSLFSSGGTAASPTVSAAISRLASSEPVASVVTSFDVNTGRALVSYLRRPGHGLFFDPGRNHDAWLRSAPLPTPVTESLDSFLEELETHFPAESLSDAAAETIGSDPDEVAEFRKKIAQASYSVPDSTATVKTRGSAQKAFANAVKENYGYRCAITGVATKDFLVAAHIVPWSKDPTIRLDPSNGICLSLLVDRAFENGCLQIDDDFTIRVDWDKVGSDQSLRSLLEPYDGQKLASERPLVDQVPVLKETLPACPRQHLIQGEQDRVKVLGVDASRPVAAEVHDGQTAVKVGRFETCRE